MMMRHKSVGVVLGTLAVVSIGACTTILGDDFTLDSTPAAGGGGAGETTTTSNGGNGASGPTMSGPGGGAVDPVCGNGMLETGEGCDDGNTESGDGCAEDCSIEGTCTSPVAIPEIEKTDSRISWQIGGKTGGESQVGVAVCGTGEAVGFGSDRIYSFTTTEVQDVTVSLSADFDGLVRVMTQPCDPASEVAAFGTTGGCSTADPLEYRDLPAGAYFVVVDGAQQKDEGDFSVAVTADCPKSYLELSEMRIGTPDTVSIRHTGSVQNCSVDLSGLSLRVATTTGAPKKTDLSGTLAPSKSLVVSDAPGPDELSAGTAWNQSQATGHYAALCRVQCDQADSVLDLFAASEGKTHPSLPPNTSFSPDGLTGIVSSVDVSRVSYQRAASAGMAPNFLKADWTVAPFGTTLFYDSFEDGDYDGWSTGNLSSIIYDVTTSSSGVHGSRAMQINGNTGTYDGLSRSFPAIQPKSIHFRVRPVLSGGGFLGWVMIGDSNLKSNDGLVQFRMGSSDVFVTFDGGSNVISVGSSNWVRIEYNNINWVNKTLDFVVKSASGSVIESFSNKSFWSQTTSSVSQVHLYNTANGSAYFDGFIMSE